MRCAERDEADARSSQLVKLKPLERLSTFGSENRRDQGMLGEVHPAHYHFHLLISKLRALSRAPVDGPRGEVSRAACRRPQSSASASIVTGGIPAAAEVSATLTMLRVGGGRSGTPGL